MDPDEFSHRRSQTTPQSIPLQDLPQPIEGGDNSSQDGRTHRRTISDRGRQLFSRGTPPGEFGRYSPLAVRSSIQRPDTYGLTPPDERESPSSDYEDVSISPHVNAAGFQSATAFGLSFQPNHSMQMNSSSLPGGPTGLRNLVGNDSTPSLADSDYLGPRMEYGSDDVEADTVHLTDRRSMQPMSTSTPAAHGRNRPSRLSTQSVRFDMGTSSPSNTRLGDDLFTADTGQALGRSGSKRKSWSPSLAVSPLQRAGTVVRMMSQRVVNLSNEPEVVGQELRRRQSKRKSHQSDEVDSRDPPDASYDGGSSPTEKFTQSSSRFPRTSWVYRANPLRGKSLGMLPKDNRLRTAVCDVLVHPITEPIILLLILTQTILLAVEAGPSVYEDPRSQSWGTSWIDYALLGLFIVYTLEIVSRTIVSGLIVNPVEYSTINRGNGLKDALMAKGRALFSLHHQAQIVAEHPFHPNQERSILRTFTGNPGQSFDSRSQARFRLAHRAFLRHSFNRLDFLAVVSYWISFCLTMTGTESSSHVYVFRMLSCLRILRLLSLTSGTSVILRSLKKAAPLLLNVALLIGFFWLLFAIVGVQSFKSSFRRTCVWVDPEGLQQNYTQEFQFCGGYLNPNGTAMPWLYGDGTSSGISKGYLCPPNSLCVLTNNPYSGTVSFDNIFQSLELVFVVMSSNTFTDLLYYMTESDYLAAALFFAFGIIVLTFWLVNLLIAVITSSFQIIREESQSSAFTAEFAQPYYPGRVNKAPKSSLRQLYDKSFWVWIAVITYGIVCQTFRSATMSSRREVFINVSETIVTVILLIEILFRFTVDWRDFFRSKRNLFDLTLAIVTAVMQLPPIRNTGQIYAWLTIFQILRIYRVVLAISWTRDLILLVLGNVSGLSNLILFVFLLTFLVAIFASQLFRGEIPQEDSNGEAIHVTFFTIWNSFLGMYQVFSSENWTTLLYNVTNYDVRHNTAWIGAIFFILWFILGFFIVLNMFIAVIQENFDVSEDEKRLQQVKAFLQQKELGASAHGTLSLSSMFKLRKLTTRRQDPLDYGPAMMEMLLKDAVVHDFLDDEPDMEDEDTQPSATSNARPVSGLISGTPLGWVPSKISKYFQPGEPNPFYSRTHFSRANEEMDPRTMAKQVVTAAEQRKRAQRDYLVRHPNYNVALYIFKPENNLRRICQRTVGPGRGVERIDGVAPNPIVWYAFSAVLYATIVAMVLLACITTPLYQREYFQEHAYSVKNWFVFTDLAFALIFTAEAAVRVVADGLFMTPNAYFRSSWGLIDGVVLITLWINVASSFYNQGDVSRAVGAFKALRALRLLNVSDSARDTFHSVIVRGGWKVLSAAFVSLSLLIPFAIYGLNLFNGRMYSCNDDTAGISNLTNCVNEYMSTPYNWDVLAPRQASNPYYDFDNFGDSLFILFQIVSQEGWTDVLWSAESITGFFTQPEPYASQFNAVFFVVFNLLGAVFVLTLFVSVFMRNYTEQTGVAFLTTDQRSWLELRKILRQVSPSKRPRSDKKRETWEQWCYRLAIRKTGRWQRFYTGVLLFHLVFLCLEFYPGNYYYDRSRDYIYLVLTLFYVFNVVVRIIGLTWSRFRKSSWDLYSLLAVSGTLVTTVLLLSNFESTAYVQLHKLFLVSIVLLLIPRNNQLDQLFKTAAASLTAIANLMATWFVLFLVYSIALTQTFGLTKFNENETGNINFRTVPKALILLFRMSTGEGWNALMEDFATVQPPYCTVGDSFFDGDCGSPEWARTLFISWNILSMYIFVNMFVSLIYESFSYVYQRSSGLSIISRNEIRRFKQAWAEYDPDGTGYISKASFPRLLGELSGVFEMRIYPEDFTIGAMKESCRADKKLPDVGLFGHSKVNTIDIEKLNEKLKDLPIDEIRQRRTRMNIFYEEVMVSADPDRGISFTSLLMILAHYRVINDNKSLRLEEFLRRRARLQRVEEAVRRTIVTSFFDTLYWSRRFRRILDAKRSARTANVPRLQVPQIFIEDEDSANPDQVVTAQQRLKPTLSLQIPSTGSSPHSSVTASGADVRRSSNVSIDGLHNRNNSIQISPTTSPTLESFPAGRPSRSQASLQHTPRLSVDAATRERRGSTQSNEPPSPLGPDDFGISRQDKGDNSETFKAHRPDRNRSRGGSAVSARDVMNVLEGSAWGDSLRRSFTIGARGSTLEDSTRTSGGSAMSGGASRPSGDLEARRSTDGGGKDHGGAAQ